MDNLTGTFFNLIEFGRNLLKLSFLPVVLLVEKGEGN